MLAIIKNLNIPRVILRHILMKYLDVVSIKIIILNVKEMNVLDEFSKEILLNAKRGLNWNCENGYLSIVQYLISLGADIHAYDNYAVRRASENGHLSVVQYLVELGNSHRLSPNSTCRYADKVSVGADIQACDNYAVKRASEYGHLSVVQYLVSVGADIHADYNYAVKGASKN